MQKHTSQGCQQNLANSKHSNKYEEAKKKNTIQSRSQNTILIYLSSTGSYCYVERAIELQSTNRGQALNSTRKNREKKQKMLNEPEVKMLIAGSQTMKRTQRFVQLMHMSDRFFILNVQQCRWVMRTDDIEEPYPSLLELCLIQ